MSARARCGRCGERLRGGAQFCPACGASQSAELGDRPVELDLLRDGTAVPPAGHEVVFERSAGSKKGKAIGGGVVVALAVAIGASVLSGGGSGESASSTTTTVASTTTTTATTATEPVTTSVPTTTTLPGPFPAGPPNMLGEPTGLQLLVTMSSDLALVDLDTGQGQIVATGVIQNDGSGVGQLSSIGFVVNELNAGLPALQRPGAKPERLVELDQNARYFGAYYIGEGPPGRLWVVRGADGGQEVGYVEPNAKVPYTSIGTLPQYGQVKPDGIGGVLFQAPGGVYRLVPGDTAVRVAEGILQDAVAGHMATIECDERLSCAIQVRSLTDGRSWRAGPLVNGLSFNGYASLAPDGRHVAETTTRADGNGESLTITIYGDDGSVTTLPTTSLASGLCGPFGCTGPGMWSSDGAWLVGIESSDTLWAWRPGLDAPVKSRLPQDRARQVLTYNGIVSVGTPASLAAPLGSLRPST